MGNKISNRQDIENLINTNVEIVNKQVFNVMNESTMSVTSNVVNNQVATKKSTGSASNLITIKRTTIKGNVYFDQISEFSQYADALITVSSDTNKLADLSSQILNDITTKISNNIDLSNDLKAANAIEKEKKVDGELNNLINAIDDAVKGLTTLGANQDNDIAIKNKIMETIKSSTFYEENLTTVINNYITSNVTNTLLNNCFDSSSSFNQVDISDLVVDTTGTLQSNQQALLTNFSSCLISNMAKNEEIQKMANDNKNKTESETTNDVKEKNTMEVTNSIKNLEIQTSIISEMLNTIIYVVAAIAILGFIILIGVPGTEALKKPLVSFFSKMKKTAPAAAAAVKDGANPKLASDVAAKAMKYFIGH